jgi:hypothetical protein
MRLLAEGIQFPANVVQGTVLLEADSKTVVFLPDSLLAGGQYYQVAIDIAMRDLSGNPAIVPQNFRRSFLTDDRVDSGPPAVTMAFPAGGSSGVPISTKIVIVFDRPIRPDSVNPALVKVESGGVPVQVYREFGGGGKAIIMRPAGLFDPLTAYSWSVEGVRDVTGTPMSGVASGTFTTGATADLVPPTLISQTPGTSTTGNPRGGPLTLGFSEPLSPDTVLNGSFRLQINGNGVDTNVTLSADGKTVTATPAQTPPPFAFVSANWFWTDLSGNTAPVFVHYTLGN